MKSLRQIISTIFLAISLTVLSAEEPPVVHSAVGDVASSKPQVLRITNIGKRQQYSSNEASTFDRDIFSPKSATFSPDGRRFYVNSLEGCKTVVYDTDSLHKCATVTYSFTAGDSIRTAPLSGYYPFTHYPGGQKRSYMGKPVESSWSHKGRYLWVPFYRRTFDINAQDPSAIAVVDAVTDSVIRIFETGPLPKMVATSNNGNLIAITHWGDNTVGFIDITGNEPAKWHHLSPVTIGYKLKLNYPVSGTHVNRDSNSGYLLRGTVFTPDDRYLLVSGMAGPLQVIDVSEGKHIGSINSLYGLRHIVIADGYLYGTHNTSGRIYKANLDSIVSAIDQAKLDNKKTITPGGDIKNVKVGGGARTLAASPDGKLLFVACNSASAVYVVNAQTMEVVDNIRCDSYPVGLALSPDGRYMAVTSQGRSGRGGNALNIFRIERPDESPQETEKAESRGDCGSTSLNVTADDGSKLPETASELTNQSFLDKFINVIRVLLTLPEKAAKAIVAVF